MNEEAGLLPPERSIGGFIPVDNNYLVAPGPDQEGACATYEATRDLLDSGVYSADYGVLFNTVSILARTAPDDPSPIVPGFNNREAALVIGSMTWLLLGVGPPPHFFAGVFDAGTGIPVDLAYTTFDGYLDFLMLPTPYEEIAPDLDIAAMRCGQIDSPFDDNLSQVRVPVLHVGAAGGITPRDDVTLGVLGSNDITTLTVRLQPVGAEVTDIGHVDLFTSQAAVDAFWRPVATWIDKHSNGRYYGERRGQVN